MPSQNPPPRRIPPKAFFGIKIVEPEKFIGTCLAIIGFVGTVVFFGTKYYLTQDFNEQKHQQERVNDKEISDLKTQLFILQNTKGFATKEDVENFESNFKKQQKNEK